MTKETILSHLRRHIAAATERGKMTPEELNRRGIPAHAHTSLLAQADEAREEATALQTALDHIVRTYEVGTAPPAEKHVASAPSAPSSVAEPATPGFGRLNEDAPAPAPEPPKGKKKGR